MSKLSKTCVFHLSPVAECSVVSFGLSDHNCIMIMTNSCLSLGKNWIGFAIIVMRGSIQNVLLEE